MTQRDAWPRDLPEEMVAELVAAATLAPSMHNTQPWRFRFDPAGETISLYADPARMLPVADPDGRSLHISCGAALFNLRLGASHHLDRVAVGHPVAQRLQRAAVFEDLARDGTHWPAPAVLADSRTNEPIGLARR